MKINLPSLPLEHVHVAPVYFDETMSSHATRGSMSNPDTPDMIQVCFHARGLGDATVYLTPAMLVHIANTILTDTERAAINAPQAAS